MNALPQRQPRDLRSARSIFFSSLGSARRIRKEGEIKILREETIVLMEYLEDHDPAMLKRAQGVERKFKHPSVYMRRTLRKTIGEIHWRRYLDYYSKRQTNRGENTKIAVTDAHRAAPPSFPPLSPDLDSDVSSVIFTFLDDKSMYEASKVSRSFRDALIPRQKNVSMSGFSSFEAFRSMPFLSMEFLYGNDCTLMTDSALDIIGNDWAAYPNLARIDLGDDCPGRTNQGEAQFVRNLGPRLERFDSCHRSDCRFYWY